MLGLTATLLAAPGNQDGAKIVNLEIRGNGTVYIVMDSPRTTWADCINTQWHKTHWAISPSTHVYYKEFLSVLLAAKTSGRPVRIVGAGNCNALATIETIDAVTVK